MPKLRPGFKEAFQFWGVAKWTKAPVFGIGIRRFESSRPSQFFAALILKFGRNTTVGQWWRFNTFWNQENHHLIDSNN